MTENVIAAKETVSVEENKEAMVSNSKKIILALQHLMAMFGATVLVPILTGFDPSVALVAAGVGTLIFHLVTKGIVPVFLGSSFAFIPVILTVKEMYNGDLTYAQGGIVVAGLLYIALSMIMRKVSNEKLTKFLPSYVVGPMIVVIGLNLVPVAFGMATQNLAIAALTLAVALAISMKGRGFIKQLAILIAIASGYIVSVFSGLVDFSIISNAPVIATPSFTLPKFDMAAIMIIAPIVMAVFMEHVGDVVTNGKVVGKNFIEEPGLKRTLLGDGLATLFAGFVGGPANTTYGENTGVLAITKNYDPSILRLAAIFAIILGFVGKLSGVLNTIPVPVMGGISFMLFSMIALVGINTIRDNKTNLGTKEIIILATILIIGLGSPYIEKYTGISLAISITDTINLSGLSLAALVGIVMNAVLCRK